MRGPEGQKISNVISFRVLQSQQDPLTITITMTMVESSNHFATIAGYYGVTVIVLHVNAFVIIFPESKSQSQSESHPLLLARLNLNLLD